MEPDPQVAIAVVSFNTRDLLRRALESLQGPANEVWVVDNGSDDGSREMVAADFPSVRLIAAEENLGFGRAVNLVAARTSAPWIAPANADIALEPGALERLVATGAAHPGAGAVAPRLILPGGGTQHSVHSFPTIPFTLAFNLGLGRVPGLGDRLCLEGRWDPNRSRDVPWAIGAFLLVRRTAFDAVGGFDERQWLYAEDLDLGWRLARGGWTTRYEPRARVGHDAGAATRAAFGELRTEQWQRATYVWLLHRRGALRTRTVAAVNVAGAAARAAGLGALARAWPERFGHAAARARVWAHLHRRTGLGPRSDLQPER